MSMRRALGLRVPRRTRRAVRPLARGARHAASPPSVRVLHVVQAPPLRRVKEPVGPAFRAAGIGARHANPLSSLRSLARPR